MTPFGGKKRSVPTIDRQLHLLWNSSEPSQIVYIKSVTFVFMSRLTRHVLTGIGCWCRGAITDREPAISAIARYETTFCGMDIGTTFYGLLWLKYHVFV